MSVSIIAAVGKNRELGAAGDLVWRSKADLKRFREITTGHPVLMGRKTFESLPKLLPERLHLVVTREAGPEFFKAHGLAADAPVKVIHDLGEVLDDYRAEEETEELFVIGGGMIYAQALAAADKLYLTEVDKEFPEADTFFPEFEKGLYEKEIIKKGEDDGVKYQFVIYTKR